MRDFALEVYFSQWEFNCRYNMTGSDAETLSLEQLLGMASPDDRQAFAQIGLGGRAHVPEGLAAMRNWIQRNTA